MAPEGKKKKKKGDSPKKPGTAAKKKGSPGAKGDKPPKAAGDAAKQLQVELGVATERLHAHEATARALEAELAALRLQHAREAAATEDVLAAQQREQRRLQAAGAELERQLDAARREAAQLQRALQEELEAAAAAEESSDDEQPSSELQRMLSHQRRQEDRLAAQAREIEGLRARLQRSELRLQQSEGAAAALRVRASSRAELRFVRGAPWLLRVERERLTGALPAAPQPGAWLAAAGRRLLLKCPPATEAEEGPQQGVLHSLDPASGVWSSAVCSGGGVDGVAPVVGRAVCSVGSKLLSFGGSQQGQLLPSHLCTQLLLPDLLEWRAAPPPADPAAPQPTPRRDAALAHCPQSNAAYLYGGRGADGVCLGDLWRLDLATHAWQQLDTVATSRPLADRARTPCASEVPPPRCGAALAVSPDGSRLWLMGGRLDSGHSTSALHWFDLPGSYWAAVDVEHSCVVEPRAHHAMACIGRHLCVVGGVTHGGGGQVAHRQDCCLYDTAAGSWDVLDGGAFEPEGAGSGEPATVVCMAGKEGQQHLGTPGARAGSSSSRPGSRDRAAAPFLGAGSCAFQGSRLLLLKPAPEGGAVGQLWTVDLTLPDTTQQMAEAKASAHAVVQELQLSCDAVEPACVRLSWRAPMTNRDKLLSYKLMMTNEEGRAREAYEGPETSCEVTGLPPASQLVFCVKALYDDGAFIWSEPRMVALPRRRAPPGGAARSGCAR